MNLHRQFNHQFNWLQLFAFAAISAGFVDLLLIFAGMEISAPALLAPFFGVIAIIAAGELLLSFVGIAVVATLPAVFVLGSAATMMAMLLLVELFGMLSQTAFLAWTAIIAASLLGKPLRRRATLASSWIDIGATLGFAVLVGFFCRDIARFLPAATAGAALPAWSDYYLHGAVIASFGDPLAIKQGNIFLAHLNRPFYHYGSFLLSAALLPSSGLSGLGLALATMLPVGLLIGLLGLYALIAELSGRVVALIATLAIACLPDASFYWMQNAFLGFRWLLYTAPGSGYALGVAAMAVACLLVGSRIRRLGPSLLGLFLLMSLFMIRFHFFVLLTPAFAGTWLLAKWDLTLKRKALLVGACFTLVFAAGMLLIASRADARAFFQPLQYAGQVLQNGPQNYSQFFQRLVGSVPLPMTLVIGVLMILVATLGVFAIGLPVVTLIWARSGKWEDLDWLPWMLVGTYTLLLLLGPTGLNTDASELKHRHFILLYATVGAWTIARAIQCIGRPILVGKPQERIALIAFMVVVLLMVLLGRGAKPARPSLAHMPWANGFYDVRIEPGIAQVASHIRRHSTSGDTLMMSGFPMRGFLQSPLTELVSLSDVPAYIGQTELLEKKGGAMLSISATRSAEVEEIVTVRSWSAACHRMQKIGVRWYVESEAGLPRWDPSKSLAVFKAGEFALYDAGSAGQNDCLSVPQ